MVVVEAAMKHYPGSRRARNEGAGKKGRQASTPYMRDRANKYDDTVNQCNKERLINKLE